MIGTARRTIAMLGALGLALLAAPLAAGCGPASATSATDMTRPATPTGAASSPAATAYRVTTRTERGTLRPGADYTVTVTIPVLAGPDENVVRRVDQAVVAYVNEEMNQTAEANLTLTAGAPHVGAAVLALSFGGDRYPPGAAHPTALAAGLVFDLRTGDRIRIEDVFTSTDAGLRRLAAIVRPELDRRFPGGPTGGVTDPVTANYQQFVVTPRGLVVIVTDLPYVLGPQSVLAPWERLRDLVRPDLAAVLNS
ncbi:RsiV family protein [Frankia sp. AgKG'84/4]|uniref:RsiV family protein n=1 Tax=Frankia sp. AgKG'84/4 TaxID=573490 RepID=UPI00200C0CB5|nr:RsiV family protein [Frankia sp. AgKG'84/4]MCL9796664.1 RsiV family protein [Frankia sp. AgKG'84/4]